jgi:hypothetical protein
MMFRFESRWKEELVCEGPGGSFVLELPMGVLTAYLPSEAAWVVKGPSWAKRMWPELRAELEQWCAQSGAKFVIDDTAGVFF